MALKEHIRQKVSQAFDVLIPPNQWERYVDLIDTNGWSRKQMLTVMMLSCQQIERLEILIEDLYFRIEILEGQKKATDTLPVYEVKLRTVGAIHAELDKQKTPESTALYVTRDDFEILEDNLNPQLAKTDPTQGYSKDVDPKDGKTKVCLLYKDLPVFRTLQ